MSAQAQEAVAERSIEERILAASQPVEESAPEPEETEAEPAVEGAEAVETSEAPETEEAVDESVLTPEQLEHFQVSVKINGEEKTVSLKEAREGYMRFEDYNRKTRELSSEKTKVPDLVKAEVEKARTDYETKVKLFNQAYFQLAGEELNNVDWNKLAEEDPAQFVKMSHKAQKVQNALKAAQQEMERIELERKAEREKTTAQALEQSVERLKEAIPNWGDELSQKITKSAIDNYGLSKEELSGIVDDRYVRILHDAMKFRELGNQKSLIDKKVADLPKVLKPGTQQSKSLVNAERKQELKANIKKSGGRSEDVVAYLMQNTRR